MLNEPRKLEDLNDDELTAYTNDNSKAAVTLIETLISIADKYGVDRDDAIQLFSRTLLKMVRRSTFKHFKTEGETDDV